MNTLFIAGLLLSGALARADIQTLQKDGIRNLQIEVVANEHCFSSGDLRRFQLSVGAQEKTFTHKFCKDDKDASQWIKLYGDVKDLVAGRSSVPCVLEESCDRRGCQRRYGMTDVTEHSLVLFVNDRNEIQDSSVTLKLKCQ